MLVEGMQLGKLLLHPFASCKHVVYVTEDKKPQTTRRLQLLSVVRDNGGNRLPAAPDRLQVSNMDNLIMLIEVGNPTTSIMVSTFSYESC